MSRPPNPKAQSQARTQLLDAAAELVERDGLEKLTMREIARAAGVSHQTPNHHFRTKDALLDELAVRGFQELDRTIGDATASASDEPRDQVLACAMGYVLFALRRRTMFRLMWKSGRAGVPDALVRAHDVSYQRFVDAFARFHGVASDDPEAQLDASLVWAAVHGVAQQVSDGIVQAQDAHGYARAVVTRLCQLVQPLATPASRASDRPLRRKS